MSAAGLLPNALSRGGDLLCCSLFGRCFEDYGSLPYSVHQLNVIRSVVGNSSAMRMKRRWERWIAQDMKVLAGYAREGNGIFGVSFREEPGGRAVWDSPARRELRPEGFWGRRQQLAASWHQGEFQLHLRVLSSVPVFVVCVPLAFCVVSGTASLEDCSVCYVAERGTRSPGAPSLGCSFLLEIKYVEYILSHENLPYPFTSIFLPPEPISSTRLPSPCFPYLLFHPGRVSVW